MTWHRFGCVRRDHNAVAPRQVAKVVETTEDLDVRVEVEHCFSARVEKVPQEPGL
jgi:hypothetical protein